MLETLLLVLLAVLLTALALLLARYLALRAELTLLRGQVEERAKMLYEEWARARERQIREDALKRSTAVVTGRVAEQLAPVLMFLRYGINPKDLRFIGTPVDYVVFRGLSEGRVEEVLFVEVKFGRSTALPDRERQVRDAVMGRRVRWVTLRLTRGARGELLSELEPG